MSREQKKGLGVPRSKAAGRSTSSAGFAEPTRPPSRKRILHNTRDIARAAYIKGYAAGQDERWIPVGEKLPELDGKYWVWQREGFDAHWKGGRWIDVIPTALGPCNVGGMLLRTQERKEVRPTHWTPLPKPPMAPHEQLKPKTMNDTSNDNQSTEDGGAVGKPAVRRSLFRRLNWTGFGFIMATSALAAATNDIVHGLPGWAFVWSLALPVAAFFLIEGRER